MRLVAGSQLGPYLVQSLVHEDEMGEVYRARDTRLDCEVGLQLTQSAIGSDGFVRFMETCRKSALFNHPNILAVYDYGWHEGRPFVVSELLQGETLRARLAAGRLAMATAAALAMQVADGLDAAHRSGVVHGELKPENVFITASGGVKILNFAPARSLTETLELFQPASHDSPTRAVVVNAVAYMSPEQANGGLIDHRTDIFSLGVVLHEMITGDAPFRRNSPIETLLAILEDDPPDLLDHPGIPHDVPRVIRRCLERDPERRVQSAHDLRSSLERSLPTVAADRPRSSFMAASEVARQIADTASAKGGTRRRA